MKLFKQNILGSIIIFSVLLISSCGNNFGNKEVFNGDEVYYKDPITKAQADSVGKFLMDYHYFTGKKYSVQLVKPGNYTCRMVVQKGIDLDEAIVSEVKEMARQMSKKVFEGQPVDIDFCDSLLVTVKAVPFEAPRPEPSIL